MCLLPIRGSIGAEVARIVTRSAARKGKGLLLLGCWLAAAGAGCQRGGAPASSGGLARTPTPDRGGPARSCDVVLRELRMALSSVSSDCGADADCTCFDHGFGPRGCGLVARRDAVRALERLVDETRRGGCAEAAECPPFECKAYCRPRGAKRGYCAQRDRCVELSDAFEATLAKAPGECKTAADCGRYRAGVGRNCGGVTDRATADALAKIAGQFFAEKCRYQVNCAPRAVRPIACAGGRCGTVLPRLYGR